jgi:hypothetical protein
LGWKRYESPGKVGEGMVFIIVILLGPTVSALTLLLSLLILTQFRDKGRAGNVLIS